MSSLTGELVTRMIGQALTCPECRERNPIGTTECGACGAPFPAPEDHRALSFLHQGGLGSSEELQFEESHHLRMLRWSVDGFRSGQLSLDDYYDQVGGVLSSAQSGLRMLRAPRTRILLERVDPEVADWIRYNVEAFEIYEDACLEMLSFDGSDLSPALAGLAQAEEALLYLAETESEANWQLEELIS